MPLPADNTVDETERAGDLRAVSDADGKGGADKAPVLTGVSAITWGPWRAEYLTATTVGIRRHDKFRGRRPAYERVVTVSETGEAGLREALLTVARADGPAAKVLNRANRRWVQRVLGPKTAAFDAEIARLPERKDVI